MCYDYLLHKTITHLPKEISYYISLLHLLKLYQVYCMSQIEDTSPHHQTSGSSSFRQEKDTQTHEISHENKRAFLLC